MAQDQELVDLQKTLYTSKNPTRRWLHCMRRDWVFSKIHTYANGAVSKSLEIGPGSGVYIPELVAGSDEVLATDIQKAHLNDIQPLCEKFPNLAVQEDNITRTTLPEKSFDLVLCSEVIEHIEDSQSVLNNVHKILKDDGVFILTTPQKYAMLELCCKIAFLPGVIQLVRLIYGEAILETGHINLMTSKTLQKQISQAGFEIHEEEVFGCYIPCVAEFLGSLGLKLEQWLQRFSLKTGFLKGMLWTQCYILKRI